MTHPNQTRWDKRFSETGYLFGRAPNTFVAREGYRFLQNGRILSVADGEGRNSVWLARQGLQLTAFDVSPVAVGKARELAREHGVESRSI